MRKCILSIIVCACSLCSCSVKEDRAGCPCILDLTLSGGADSKVTVAVWGGGLQHREEINTYDGNRHHECEIARGRFTLSACSGLRHSLGPEGRIVLSKGEEMDEIYADACPLDAVEERVSASVSLHKEYAQVNITLLCMKEDMPQAIVLKGNVCGLDLLDLSPLDGEYERSLVPIVGEYCRAAVPRQKDDSLVLTIGDGGDFPIGKYIEAAGYDWSAPDLKDIFIDIDLIDYEVSLRIADWADVETFELII